MNQQVCDSNRLSAFVRGELSAHEEHELEAHLDRCASCGSALELQVAEASCWQEAQELLGDHGSQVHDTNLILRRTKDSQIQQVLSQLLPTDDPHSLGRMGDYEVTCVIGSGGMGVVLKAHDHSLDRVVALKVMGPHLATSGSARQRFAREAKAAAAVLHPNVIAIHGVSNHHSLPYLVMPYVKGTSLQKRVDCEGPLPLMDVLRIGAQIAAGLAAAHEQGLVHRDIKPGNILLEQGVERITITDFGLARAVDDASMTRSGVIAGTPQFMSPEQARGESVDQASDLFSLGSVLYALATGRPPFRAETALGVMRRITDETPVPIRELNSQIPEWFCAIVSRLMAKKKDARFKSAAQVHELLEACLSHAQQPTTTRLPALPKLERDSRIPPFLKFLVGVLTMGIIVSGLLLFFGVLQFLQQEKNVDKETSSQTYQKEFVVAFANPDEVGTLNVDIKRGSIQVSGYDGDKVIVELSVPDYSPSTNQTAEGLTELRPNTLDFEIEKSADQIKVDGNSYSQITNLIIKVPRKTNLILDSYRDGLIRVQDVEGTINVRSQNNDIRLESVSGSARVWSYNGAVSASFAAVANDQPLYFKSYNGSIDLMLPPDTKANARYRSGSGKVLTDFEIELAEETAQDASDDNIRFGEFVQGTLNGGGPLLTLDSEKGDIRLRKKKSNSIR